MLNRTIIAQILVVGVISVAITSCACTDNRSPKVNQTTADRNNPNNPNQKEIADAGALAAPTLLAPLQATANIKQFKGGAAITGQVTFTKVPDGVKIVADIDGLTPGQHGFHVHEFGDCSGDGTAAGAHYNPTDHNHGAPDSPFRHVGDLGNVVADERGHGHYERVDKVIALDGPYSIVGRSIIIHADPDDYKTQPTGNSGKKIACGVIEMVSTD